jgi:hypothetical protein
MRASPVRQLVRPEISRFPCKERAHMPGSSTTPGHPSTCVGALGRVAFRTEDGVGTRDMVLSWLNGWPVRSPVNASPHTSRCVAHDSGPMWFANPSSQRTCTAYSLPVSRRTLCDLCVKWRPANWRGWMHARHLVGRAFTQRSQRHRGHSEEEPESQNQFMSLRHRTEIPGCGAAYAGMAPSAGSLCRFLSLAPAARKSARTRRALAAAAMRAPLR